MKILIILILFILYSCGYPDIDSVPKFNEVNLTEDELIDLCELSTNDKSEFDTCLKDKNNQ